MPTVPLPPWLTPVPTMFSAPVLTMLMLLLVALGLTWLVSYGWARSLARGLRVVRERRFGWAQVGDRLEERFTVINDSGLPCLWLEVADHSTLPDYQASKVTGVDGQSTNIWHTQGVCARRGIFTLGPTTLRTTDPFGLYTVSIADAASATLVVMPPVVPLPMIEVAPGGRVVGEFSGSFRCWAANSGSGAGAAGVLSWSSSWLSSWSTSMFKSSS